MEYVNFGSAGVKVSRIALGLGFRGQSSLDEAQRVIEHAIDSGVNFLDCANGYGARLGGPGLSEKVLGRVLRTRRDEVVITTKVNSTMGDGPNDKGISRYHIMKEVENSLRRLGTDHIDIYLLHQPDDSTPLEETIRALDDLVTQGKVRYVGCCNFAAWQVCKALWVADRLNADPFICVQNQYSLLGRALESEMFGLVRDQGLGVMVFSPLAVGLLSGAYHPDQLPPKGSAWEDRREDFQRLMSGGGRGVVQAAQDIASERGKTAAQVSLNWVLSQPEVTVAISGCDTIEHLDDNLGAVGWELTGDELAKLDDASRDLGDILERAIAGRAVWPKETAPR